MQLLLCRAELDGWFHDLNIEHFSKTAITSADASSTSLDVLAKLVNLPVNALLPEEALPLQQLAISTGQLEPHLELCLSFLKAFSTADHHGKNPKAEARQAAGPGSLPNAAITAPDSSKTSTHSTTAAANADAHNKPMNDQDRHQAETALTIKLHLYAAIVVTKIIHLAQPVRAQTSTARMHGPLLLTACKLLADLPEADNNARVTTREDEAEFDYLIQLLMQPATALLQQAATCEHDALHGLHKVVGHLLAWVKDYSICLYNTVLTEFIDQGTASLDDRS